MSRWRAGARFALAALSLCAACHPRGAARAHGTTIQSCHYQVALSAEGLANVSATCKADGAIAFRVAERRLAGSVSSTATGKAGHFRSSNGRLSYVVDLAKLAGHGHDFDRAARVGASFIATMSSVLLGQHATQKAMYSDWILVHELFHLGFPSFFDEGKWLDEGLATYYEPIIRVRAGLYTDTELWDELSSKMPQGLAAFTEHGLEKADDFRGIYWGGALACLLADVTARKRNPERGLEVGLRALREAGGTASEVWTLADAITAIDHALGAPTLEPIAREHAQRGSAFDLPALFSALGVTRDAHGARGALQLSDTAPLAAVRRAITARP